MATTKTLVTGVNNEVGREVVKELMRQNKDVRGFVSRDEAWHQPPDWDIEVIRRLSLNTTTRRNIYGQGIGDRCSGSGR